MEKYVKVAFLTLITAILPVNLAFSQTSLMVDIAPCMVIENAPKRYACYDELANLADPTLSASDSTPSSASTTQLPPTVAVPVNAPPSQQNSLATFGLEEKTSIEPSQAEQETASIFVDKGTTVTTLADGEEELQDRIVDLSRGRNNYWVITLEGGQVWRQTADKRFNLRKGALVKIAPSRWGKSYRLRMEGRSGFLQVQRSK